MSIQIIGSFDRDKLYCAGSLTKLLTTYVALSFLSEKYQLENILDDRNFLDTLCTNQTSRKFLTHFQTLIGNNFSIRDLCSYYSGLPYTFDASCEELEKVDNGQPFKHHSIPDENVFLAMCQHNITPVYTNQCKFHYSEISIIFFAYFLEISQGVTFEKLYQDYLINKFSLKSSTFSRKMINGVYTQDLSDRYDYPSIAINDHGFFCYSNGFYTTLNDMKNLLENILNNHVFHHMIDINHARAASNRLMNGLTVELRLAKDDLIYGYEGLSFSGCNLWAYSTKENRGYITFNDSEEEIYKIIYDDILGYHQFDIVPDHTQTIYQTFLRTYHEHFDTKNIPEIYQGHYHRVNINDTALPNIFIVGRDYIVIRNPDEIKYDVVHVNGNYRVKGKDHIHGAKVGFYHTEKDNRYFFYDGTLYKKI